jgi:Regulator of chromosome condensation (RCC1) repeat
MRARMAAGLLVCALLLALHASSASAGPRPRHPRLTVSFVAVGSEIDATGAFDGRGGRRRGSPGKWRAVLQERIGRRWLVRARGPLRAHRRQHGFSLTWRGASPGHRAHLRVEIRSGRRVLARTKAHSVWSSSPYSVKSILRKSAVQLPANKVLSVSGTPSSTSVIVLARNSRVPAVGGALVLMPSTKTPDGLLGVVSSISRLPGGSVRVVTRRGTLEDAYSSFDAHLNGELGELLAGATTASTHARAAVDLGMLDPSFSCPDPAVQAKVTHHIDLSKMHVSANVAIPSPSNGYYGPGVRFALYGRPKLEFGVTFTGSEGCDAHVLIKIPIPDTPGLFLEIGPNFALRASGAVGVSFAWEPWVFYGFARYRGGPNEDTHEFRNGGRVNFTKAAGLTLSLALDAGLSLGGRVGVRGSLGPEITGKLSQQISPPETCLTADADFAASLSVFAKAFFTDWSFQISSVKFGDMHLYRDCVASTSGGGSGESGGGGGGGSPGKGGGTPEGGINSSSTPAVAAGDSSACALLSSGQVKCWGWNGFGQLGNETTEDSNTPVQVSGLTNATAVAAGTRGACAVLSGGQVDCWGWNVYGKLGDGTTTGPESCGGFSCSTTPVQVSGITNATAVAVGEVSACAVLSGGQVDCWGENGSGQLGDGTFTGPEDCGGEPCSTTPVQVSGITNATAVAVGEESTCALLSNGQADCWGWNVYGQLGDGTSVGPESCNMGIELYPCSTTPVQVRGLTNATAVAAGSEDACAVLSGGQVDCWGVNFFGELGDGTSTGPESCREAGEYGKPYPCSTTPVQVSGIP